MSRSCHSGWFSKRGLGVAAQQAGQAGDPLGEDRVALVGHRRAALLAGPERLHELADLGVLEVADLGREALQRAAGDRDRGQERGVPVALDDLGARPGRRARPSVGEDLGLEVRVEVAVGADRARRSCPSPTSSTAAAEAPPVAVELEGPAGELEPEGGRLGVDRVGAAHHHRVRPPRGPARRAAAMQPRRRRAEQARPAARQLERRAPCRRRRCWSARGGGSGPPARPSRRPG